MALCAIIYLPSLAWALGLDQNIFAEIGALLLRGKTLYVDAWDVKPPNVFYLYALFEWLFGPHDFAVRVSDYIFTLFACAAVFGAAERQWLPADRGHEWIGPLAAVLLALTLLSLGLADTAQTESYSLLFIIEAGVLLSGPARTHAWRFFFGGALLSIAAFFKTTNAIFLLPLALEIVFVNRKASLRPIFISIAGFAAWSMLQCGVLAIQGSLEAYFQIAMSVFEHHPNEVSQLQISDLPRAVWTYVDLWSILALGAIACSLLRRDDVFLRSIRLPLLLLAAGIAAVILQNKGWGYQYVVLLPGLIPLCALAASYLYRMLRARSRALAMVLASVAVIATLFATPSARRRIRYTSDALVSIQNHSRYLASLGSQKSLYYPPCTDSLASYIAEHTAPGEEVFILGEEPGAYWRAERLPATRFVYTLLFTSGVISSDDIRAMCDTLARKKPPMILVERYDTTWFRGRPETSESLLMTDAQLMPLKILLATEYVESDLVCEKFVVYRR